MDILKFAMDAMQLNDNRHLDSLPPELLIEVLSHLRVRDILTMRRLNKGYNNFLKVFQNHLADRLIAKAHHRLATDIRDLDFHAVGIFTAARNYLRVCKTHLYPSFNNLDAIGELNNLGLYYTMQNPSPWRKKSFDDHLNIFTHRQLPVGYAAELFMEEMLLRMSAVWRLAISDRRVPAMSMLLMRHASVVCFGDDRDVLGSLLEAALAADGERAFEDIHPVAGADSSVRICEVDAMLHRHARSYSTMPNAKAHFWKWKKEAFEVLGLPQTPKAKGVWPTFVWPTDYSRREKKLRSWELLCDWLNIGRRPSRMQMVAVLEDASLGLKSDGKDIRYED